MAKFDNFFLGKVFAEPEKVFRFNHHGIDKVKDSCIYVFDTNVLLVPYVISKQGVADYKKIFLRLKKESRILIPARVAIEFAVNRGRKLSLVFAKIIEYKERLNRDNLKLENFPLLEDQSDYKEAKDIEVKIAALKKEYRKCLDSIENRIKNWNWNDPVSKAYKDIFTKDIIVGVKKEEAELERDLEYRILHKIPPGYMDKAKADNGIGDLIIWQTVLEIGKDKALDVVFVTNEKKQDWFYVQQKTGVFPRFELYEEFRSFTGGKSINIISFSDFLNLQQAKEETVDEVRREAKAFEAVERESESEIIHFKEKDRVYHPKYGLGNILVIENRPDNSKIGKILFDDCGEKDLLLHVHDLRCVRAENENDCKFEPEI